MCIRDRWMIASDIHGSAYYCRELLEAYDREKADRLLLLGDILYHGPRNDLPKDYNPKEVIALLNQHKQDILCVRGNCDTEVDQMVLEFPVLADYCVIADEKDVYKRQVYAHEELIELLKNLAVKLLQKKDVAFIGKRLHLIPVADDESVSILSKKVTFFDIQSTKAKQFGFCMELGNGEKLTCCGDEPYNPCLLYTSRCV